jgi:hypothetical protein
MIAGFVTYEIAGEVKWVKEVFLSAPHYAAAFLPPMNFGWLKATWMLFVFPLLIWSLAGMSAFLLGYRGNIRDLAIDMATGSALVVAVMHLAKGLAKLSSWGLYLPLALKEPSGVDAAEAIINRSMPQPGSIVSLEFLGWIMILALLFAARKSVKWINVTCSESPEAARMGILVPFILYLAIQLAWIGVY